jgi:hypothetical protein
VTITYLNEYQTSDEQRRLNLDECICVRSGQLRGGEGHRKCLLLDDPVSLHYIIFKAQILSSSLPAFMYEIYADK